MECHTGQIDEYSIWAKPKIWRPSIEFKESKQTLTTVQVSNYSSYVILIQNNRGNNNSTVMGIATIPTHLLPSIVLLINSPTKATWIIIPGKHQMECLGWELRIALTSTQLVWQRMLRTQWMLRTVSVKKVPWSILKIGLGRSITTLAKQLLPHITAPPTCSYFCALNKH